MLPSPGQQLVDALGRMIGDAGEDIGEVGFGLEAVQLGRLDDGVEDGGALVRRRPTRPHNARILGREVEVAYPFHPLFRRSAIVIGDQLHNGTRHLTLRSGEGPSFLVPAWMADPEAASVKIVDAPCLSIARLLDLRAFLDFWPSLRPEGRDPRGRR